MSAKEFLKSTQPYIYTTEAAKMLDIPAPISSSLIADLSDPTSGYKMNSDADVVSYVAEGANRICTDTSASQPSNPTSTEGGERPTSIHTILPDSLGFKIGPLTIRVLEDGPRTEGRMSVVTITLPPKTGGPPMLWHEAHDEGFLTTRGRVRFSTRRYLDIEVSGIVRMAEELLHLGARPISQNDTLRLRPKSDKPLAEDNAVD